jgi:hypothetical protein
MIGSGIPISQSSAPLPNPIVLSLSRFRLLLKRLPTFFVPSERGLQAGLGRSHLEFAPQDVNCTLDVTL